jgi:hypothetical protein
MITFHLSINSTSTKENQVMDVVYVGLTVLFFVLCGFYVAFLSEERK